MCEREVCIPGLKKNERVSDERVERERERERERKGEREREREREVKQRPGVTHSPT